jgi:meiotically up-regulated gene 157 (Mug157) protein
MSGSCFFSFLFVCLFLSFSLSFFRPYLSAGRYVFERKYELDSLCAFFKLSSDYFVASNDTSPFDADWLDAVTAALNTMVAFQSSTADYTGGYSFQRCSSCEPTDTLSHGMGFPVKATGLMTCFGFFSLFTDSTSGLIRSLFRPSDDSTLFAFNIPSNASTCWFCMYIYQKQNRFCHSHACAKPVAVVELKRLATLLRVIKQSQLASNLSNLAAQVEAAIQAHGIVDHPLAGRVFAYEVDGFGNFVFMDDANVPSLLSLPYLGFIDRQVLSASC